MALNNGIAVGDKVRCLKFVQFCYDEPPHDVGQVFEVTEETLSYYTLFTNGSNYEKIEEDL